MDIIQGGMLKVDPGLIIWTMITFLILLLILWKAAWKPLVEALDSRAERVRGDIEHAEKARDEAEALLEQHKEMMAKANEQINELMAKSRQDAENLKEDIVERAREEAAAMTSRSQREIQSAKEQALAELKSEIVMISTEIASKIVMKNISPDDQKGLVADAMKKLETV